jgi:hypothetical protein
MISAPTAPTPANATYGCGPVTLKIAFTDSGLGDALHGLLSQYDAPWPNPVLVIDVMIGCGAPPSDTAEPSGVYFRSGLLRGERRDGRLISLSKSGVWLEYDLTALAATVLIPPGSHGSAIVEETEQQLILLLARAWAQAGWTPLHAGSLVPPEGNRCVLLCAPSGVGKTTLITAMLRRGWRTLGDDKTLLQTGPDGLVARALARRFHLHPASSPWFPELGDLGACPHYSRWTDKRVVPIASAWPDRLIGSAIPAAVVQLQRIENGLEVEPMPAMTTLYTLLRQVAIPADPEHARPLVACIGALADQVKSASVKMGHAVYDDPALVGRLEAALRGLLT